MQHFQSKSTSFVHILLLSIEKRIIFSLFQYFKERLGLAERALGAAELQVNLQQHKQLNFNNYCA
jgi:hypothetical protein